MKKSFHHWGAAVAYLLGAFILLVAASLQSATITIVNLDGPNEGFNDPAPATPIAGNTGTTIGQQRLKVFERAAQIWGARLVSSVPIRVAAKFDPLSCTTSQGVLGSAGPSTVIRDFAGAPLANTWYAIALASALAGEDLDDNNDDILATFNSELGKAGCLTAYSWYYGLDYNTPPNAINLLDTILHEFGHGLGFLSTVNLSTGGKLNGVNDIFMVHLEDHTTGKTYPQMTDTERREANTQTGNLHWVGSNVIARSGILTSGRGPGGHVEMYAPDPAESGSSVSHFSNTLTPDELMEPFATPTADMRLTIELMKDIGWTIIESGPVIAASGSAITSESCSNGAMDPGENVSVSFSLFNTGTMGTSNLVATLLASGGVSSPSSPQSYGALAANGSAVARSFSFVANRPCGGTLTATLQLQDGTNNLGTLEFSFKLGKAVLFTNSVDINIPPSGSASPYPSTITVLGQTSPMNGVVVRLFNLQHPNPDELDVLLVGPNGQTVLLMSDAGGLPDVLGANVTFDDAAPTSIPDFGPLTSGTYRPTNFGVDENFPSPAPGGPYGTTLSVFDGTSANGTWSLYVVDDDHPRGGAIAGGWSLSFGVCCVGGSNAPPLLTVSTSAVSFVENSSPILLDSSGIVSDTDSTDFNTGRLTVEITANGSIDDRLAVRNQGTGAGQIGVSNNVVRFGGSIIGTWSGGLTGSSPLLVDFITPSATSAAVQALLRNLTFQNVSENPSTAARTVRFELSDGDGGTATPATRTVTVSAVNDAPSLGPLATRTVNEGSALTVTNTATDPDTSLALLTFSLPVAPLGMSINPTNGLITWTPSEGQGPTTNPVRVVVTDNGSLTATQNFEVVVVEVNEAPVLASITGRIIHQGVTVVFTNAATDVDLPANDLAFSLSNPPAGAGVGSTSGVFTWTPLPEDANTTNLITVVVSDNGTPPLTDAKTFSITVRSAPAIESISVVDGDVTLIWTSILGGVYRVEYKSSFDETSWSELPDDVIASGSTATKMDSLGSETQRFYRVRVVQQ